MDKLGMTYNVHAVRHAQLVHGVHVQEDVDDVAGLKKGDGAFVVDLRLEQSLCHGKESVAQTLWVPVFRAIREAKMTTTRLS